MNSYSTGDVSKSDELQFMILHDNVSDVTPSAVHVGNIVQGARMAWAQGRDIGIVDEDSDQARKVSCTSILHAVVEPVALSLSNLNII